MTKLSTRRSVCLAKYNYSQPGQYFITICSQNRKCIFGQIQNTKCVGAGLAPARIELTNIGKIIDQQWRDIPNQYKNIEIDEYIVMPNHIHGIVIIRAAVRAAPTYLSQCIF